MRKLSVEIWESSSGDARCQDIRPMLVICDERLTVNDFSELVQRKYAEIHVGKPKLRIKCITDAYGSVVGCDLLVGMVWEDRTKVSNPNEFTVRVFREPPTQDELQGFERTRMMSLAPESSARPQKRARASIPVFQPNGSRGLPEMEFGDQYQTKRQKVGHNGLDSVLEGRDIVRSVERDGQDVEDTDMDLAAPIVIADSQQSPGRNALDASVAQAATEHRETPKTESPEPDNSVLRSLPQSQPGTPHSEPTETGRLPLTAFASVEVHSNTSKSPSIRQNKGLENHQLKAFTPKNPCSGSSSAIQGKSPRSLISSAKAFRKTTVERGSNPRPRGDIFEFPSDEDTRPTPPQKRLRTASSRTAAQRNSFRTSSSSSRQRSEEQDVSLPAQAVKSVSNVSPGSFTMPRSARITDRNDYTQSGKALATAKTKKALSGHSETRNDDGIGDGENGPCLDDLHQPDQEFSNISARKELEAEGSMETEDAIESSSELHLSGGIHDNSNKAKTNAEKRKSKKRTLIGSKRTEKESLGGTFKPDVPSKHNGNDMPDARTPLKSHAGQLGSSASRRSNKLTPLVPGSRPKQSLKNVDSTRTTEKSPPTPSAKQKTTGSALKAKDSLPSSTRRSVSFDAVALASKNELAGQDPSTEAMTKAEEAKKERAPKIKSSSFAGRGDYFAQLFAQPVPAAFVDCQNMSPPPRPTGRGKSSNPPTQEASNVPVTKLVGANAAAKADDDHPINAHSGARSVTVQGDTSNETPIDPIMQDLREILEETGAKAKGSSKPNKSVRTATTRPSVSSALQEPPKISENGHLNVPDIRTRRSASRGSTPKSTAMSDSRSPAREVQSASPSASDDSESEEEEVDEDSAEDNEVSDVGSAQHLDIKKGKDAEYSEVGEEEEDEDDEDEDVPDEEEEEEEEQNNAEDQASLQNEELHAKPSQPGDKVNGMGITTAVKSNAPGSAAPSQGSSTELDNSSDESSSSGTESEEEDVTLPARADAMSKSKDRSSEEAREAAYQLQQESTQSLNPPTQQASTTLVPPAGLSASLKSKAMATPARSRASNGDISDFGTPSSASGRPALHNSQFPSFTNLKSNSINVRTPPAATNAQKKFPAYKNPITKAITITGRGAKASAGEDAEDEEDSDSSSSSGDDDDENDETKTEKSKGGRKNVIASLWKFGSSQSK